MPGVWPQHLPGPVVKGEGGGHHPQLRFAPRAGGRGRAGRPPGGGWDGLHPGQQGQGREGRRQGGQDAFAMVHSTSVRGIPRAK